jgi:murein DD-endopeptidase MepM/ murein hydrolase activator NlpD
MSPSVLGRRRPGRPTRRSRARNQPPQRPVISAVVERAIHARMPATKAAWVVTMVWLTGVGLYVAFCDDFLTRLMTEMRATYEDHIVELRAQVDRVKSRQFLDQTRVERQLNALLQRQTTLEQHTSVLAGHLSATGSINTALAAPPAGRTIGSGPGVTLARVAMSLDKIEHRQAAVLTDLETRIDTRARNMRSVLSDFGVNADKASENSATGGPWVAMKPPQLGASAFEGLLYRISVARLQIDRYMDALAAVPVRKPVSGNFDMTSPFGSRMDPFLGRASIHTGIDLRGDVGQPVLATATGRVTIAGREGGYGNMVEINHGNGLATRYGHLSEIDVHVGQIVRIGEVIGKIGSTGRSTGPHLHYETRINGEAVDPKKFLRAGFWLGNV